METAIPAQEATHLAIEECSDGREPGEYNDYCSDHLRENITV